MYIIKIKGQSDLTGQYQECLYHKIFLFKPSKKQINKAIEACRPKSGLDLGALDLSTDYEVKILKLKFSL